MSSSPCWQCGEQYSYSELLDIPVFRKGFTVKWCLKCLNKQLKIMDYKLVKIKTKF